MARRGENIRRRTDGRWEGRAMVYFPNGEKKMRSFYGKTYQEVKDKMLYFQNGDPDLKDGTCILEDFELENAGTTQSVWGTIAEEWLKTIRKTRKYSTYIKYQNIYESYLNKYFRRCFTEEGAEEAVFKEIFEEYADYSDSIKRSILLVLRNVFSYGAETYKLKVPEIKCEFLKKDRKNKLQVLSEAEQNTLWNYLMDGLKDGKDDKLLGIMICFSTGLRLGEICALKWTDIDLKSGILSVNSTVQRIAADDHPTKTILLETEPKTPCSKREIPLPDMLLKFLKQYYGKGTYVVGGDQAMEPRTYQNLWRRYQKEAGISYKNFHCLRHTFATNCISQGADVKSLSEILGHSDVKITLNKYVHPSMETKRAHINSVYFYLVQACPVSDNSIKDQNDEAEKLGNTLKA